MGDCLICDNEPFHFVRTFIFCLVWLGLFSFRVSYHTLPVNFGLGPFFFLLS